DDGTARCESHGNKASTPQKSSAAWLRLHRIPPCSCVVSLASTDRSSGCGARHAMVRRSTLHGKPKVRTHTDQGRRARQSQDWKSWRAVARELHGAILHVRGAK